MKATVFLCILLFLMLTSVSAQTQVGRYMTVSNAASISQRDPLQQTFQITFPASIQTVGDAINLVVINTGYQLVPEAAQTKMVKQLLNQALPLSVRSMGPTTVEAGLLALSGSAYQLVIDPAHRLITYRLKPTYASIYQNQDGDQS